jgi:3-oxoacyl-[acyl-carrier protein] reductase/meso-butanediol dehydrogenase/(S,S)-butanediol dehydrogenase/diacetyl reductase
VLVATDGLIDALNSPHSPAKDNTKKFLDDFVATQSALGRLPTAEEVGAVCVFLASDKASAITGQCINVDCGVFPQ